MLWLAHKLLWLAHKLLWLAHKLLWLAHKLLWLAHKLLWLAHKLLWLAHKLLWLAHKLLWFAHKLLWLAHKLLWLSLSLCLSLFPTAPSLVDRCKKILFIWFKKYFISHIKACKENKFRSTIFVQDEPFNLNSHLHSYFLSVSVSHI
jgi:hypothetical protein